MAGYVSQIWNPAAFEYGWFPALRSRYYKAATAVVIADSKGEGVQSGAPVYLNRWIYRLQTALRTSHPTPGQAPGGIGFMPSHYADSLTIADDTTRSGGGVFTESNWIWGPGGKALRVPGTGSGRVTFPAQAMTSFTVWYGRNSTLGGQGAAEVDGVQQAATMNGSAGTIQDGFSQSYTTTAASHTVAVKGLTAGAQFPLVGAHFYNGDEGRGIHVIDGTHSGGNASHWVQSSMDPMWTGYIPAVKPALFYIALGTNDWSSFTAAQYLSNIDGILSRIATNMGTSPHTVAFEMPYRPGRAARDGVQVWADMMAGLAARAVDNVCAIPMSPPWPELLPDGSTNAGLMLEATDPVHPGPSGHVLYAEIVHDALSLPEVRKPPAYIGGTYLPGHSKVRFS